MEVIELELRVGLALEETVEFGLVEGVGLVGYYILKGRAHNIRIIESLIAILERMIKRNNYYEGGFMLG